MTPYSSPLHNLEDVALLILCKPQSVSTLRTFLGNWAIACREGAVDQKSVALQAFKFVIPCTRRARDINAADWKLKYSLFTEGSTWMHGNSERV